MVGRLEERIRELVGQVDDEARRMAEAVKNLKKTERGVKECNYRAGEDGKNSERIKDLIDKLQHQVRMYKKQLEEAEEIAALNLAKFRQTQSALGEAAQRAELTEQAAARLTVSRAASIAP